MTLNEWFNAKEKGGYWPLITFGAMFLGGGLIQPVALGATIQVIGILGIFIFGIAAFVSMGNGFIGSLKDKEE